MLLMCDHCFHFPKGRDPTKYKGFQIEAQLSAHGTSPKKEQVSFSQILCSSANATITITEDEMISLKP